MRNRDAAYKAYKAKVETFAYEYVHYKKFDYSKLNFIPYLYRAGRGDPISFNDVIIMIDTETSKKRPDEPYEDKDGSIKYKTDANHICAWTLSIRAFHKNICTLYGRKPSTLVQTMLRIHSQMAGMRTIFYCHNLQYDYYFLRRFFILLYGEPVHQLNTKPHYPIYIEYDNGIVLKDSLILFQRKLEKVAADLNVEHQKQVGKWDYEKIRNQNTPLDADEKDYIECDTLAGVESIDAYMQSLGKKIYSMPYTATGIPREQTRKRGKKKAHDQFLKMCLSYLQYDKAQKCYHGGFTHGNRHYINQLINWKPIQAYDFASSYPFIMCAFKFPMEKFTPRSDCNIEHIINMKEKYAYMFKFTAVNIRLKTDAEPMPALQFSKCTKTINAILDNGRVLAANFISIYLTEWDAAVIYEQYECDKHICTEVECAYKDYLPRWFTDYVFECFTGKTMLKNNGVDPYDPVAYTLKKGETNSLYGMTVQKPLKEDIKENTTDKVIELKDGTQVLPGDYYIQDFEDPVKAYEEYIQKVRTILPYQWGVTVTAAAFYNIHQLIKCCRLPLYSDTDSCYGIDWDIDKVNAYNQHCKDLLTANGYGAVIRDGREYWLGVAEHDPEGDTYTEFKYMGAKRNCGRNATTGKLKITVAGVPKKKGAECLNDNIDSFHPGFIFSGLTTGKKTHVYIPALDGIYTDANGNETGDSISLIPCDYKLDSVNVIDWESIFNEDVEVQIYDDAD